MGKIKPLTHRDQIHHDTKLDPLSVALLDTAPLQRLGRVFQLGYAHLVFRGGTHTRLSHVLGASHVAEQLVLNLRSNYSDQNTEFRPTAAISPEQFLPFQSAGSSGSRATSERRTEARWDFLRYVCKWAALLHDVGHIPLGHTLEDEYEQIFPKHDDFTNPRLHSLWLDSDAGRSEIRSVLQDSSLYPHSFRDLSVSTGDVFDAVLLICCHKEDRARKLTFKQLLEEERRKERQDPNFFPNAEVRVEDSFVEVLLSALERQCGESGRGAFQVFMADLVANTICADYLDYMQRDPYNVGLDVLRDQRVATRFFVGEHQRWGKRMALSLVDRSGKPRMDTASGVFELVRQRFRFAESIYYHKTKVAASAMFVKALSMLRDRPLAHGQINSQVDLFAVERLAEEIAQSPKQLRAHRSRFLPANLLSPDLGDDSVHLFLQQRAWQQIEESAASLKGKSEGEQKVAREDIRRGLLAVSLLGGISRRRLFKQSFYMDEALALQLLSIPETQKEEVIGDLIEVLRARHETRASIEDAMCEAAEAPAGSIILYVPGRKSQAKGVETFAISGEGVITLGDHERLKQKMKELNRDYYNLWRMLLFVHPSLQAESLRLSRAIDILITRLRRLAYPSVRTDDQAHLSDRVVEMALINGSRIPYIPIRHRKSAELLSKLSRRRFAEGPPFGTLMDVERRAAAGSDSVATDSLAYSSFVLACLRSTAVSNHPRFDQEFAALLDGDTLKSSIKTEELAFNSAGDLFDNDIDQLAAQLERVATSIENRLLGSAGG